MNKMSLYLGKIAGIKLFIHWSFLLLIAWILISSYRSGLSANSTLFALGFVLTVFVCVVLHEFGHALTAKHFKYTTHDITLLPIGGLARMDALPENPRQELAVALAGPLVNIVIALLLLPVVLHVGQGNYDVVLVSNSWQNFVFSLFLVNITLALFNLVPAFPMDGGRVFRALLSFFMPCVKATHIATRTGQVVSILFVMVGLFYNPVLVIIGVFIFIMAQAENQQVKSSSMLQGYTVKDVLMKKYYSLDESASIDDAVKGLLDVQASEFLIMKDGNVTGTLNRDEIIRAITTHGIDSPVTRAMNAPFRSLSPEMPLEQVFREFKGGKSAILPVFEGKQLIGVVDLNNILELILITEASEKHRITSSRSSRTQSS